MIRAVGARTQRAKRALEVTRVARRSGLLRVLREIGVAGERPATREGARRFRLALEELGTTYIKLGQLLSSRPDLLPDVYIEELANRRLGAPGAVRGDRARDPAGARRRRLLADRPRAARDRVDRPDPR